jgi:hypothetical protein
MDKAERTREAAVCYNDPTDDRTLRDLAIDFDIGKESIRRYAKDPSRKDRVEAAESRRRLSHAEEWVLANVIEISAQRAMPLTVKKIEQRVVQILKMKEGSRYVPLGKNMVDHFLDRHRKTLKTYWSSNLDTKRGRALNPDTVTHYYENIIKKEIHDAGIPAELVWAMDESGCPPEASTTQRVVGSAGQKMQHKKGGVNRENVTAFAVISAAGERGKPHIIFKAKNLQAGWMRDNPADAS